MKEHHFEDEQRGLMPGAGLHDFWAQAEGSPNLLKRTHQAKPCQHSLPLPSILCSPVADIRDDDLSQPGPSGYQETVILWLKIQVLQHHLTCALPRLLPAPRPSPWGHLMVSLQGLLGRVPLRSKQLLWLIHFLCAFARYIIKSSAEGGNKAHH